MCDYNCKVCADIDAYAGLHTDRSAHWAGDVYVQLKSKRDHVQRLANRARMARVGSDRRKRAVRLALLVQQLSALVAELQAAITDGATSVTDLYRGGHAVAVAASGRMMEDMHGSKVLFSSCLSCADGSCGHHDHADHCTSCDSGDCDHGCRDQQVMTFISNPQDRHVALVAK
jgi:hypothetical protein